MGEIKSAKAFKQLVTFYECPYCGEIMEYNEYEADYCGHCNKEVNVEL